MILHSLILLQSVYPPIHSAMYKLFSEQEAERVRLAAALLTEQVCVVVVRVSVCVCVMCVFGGVEVGVSGGVCACDCECVCVCTCICVWSSTHPPLTVIPSQSPGSSGALNGARAGQSPPACHQIPHPNQCLCCVAGTTTAQEQ